MGRGGFEGRPVETKNPEAVASGSGFPRESEKTRPYDAAMAWREMRMPIVSAKGFMVRTSSTSGGMVRGGQPEVKRPLRSGHSRTHPRTTGADRRGRRGVASPFAIG